MNEKLVSVNLCYFHGFWPCWPVEIDHGIFDDFRLITSEREVFCCSYSEFRA